MFINISLLSWIVPTNKVYNGSSSNTPPSGNYPQRNVPNVAGREHILTLYNILEGIIYPIQRGRVITLDHVVLEG
jgi:hypothetical protein